MPDPQSLPLTFGVRGAYEWLASEHCLDDLLRLCPQIVLGKYIAVTSVDSGSFFPTAEELAKGWERRNGIAYSPKVEKVEILPREGWDEWYAFEDRVDLGGMAARDSNPFEASLGPGAVYAFVNYNSLGLDLPKLQGIAPYFWKQFDWIRPRTYVAESGDYLVVISSDKKFFGVAREALAGLEPSNDDSSDSDGSQS
jgi:hypothetical protein